MLRNNIELDVKIKCIEQNKPQSKIAEENRNVCSVREPDCKQR